MNWMKTSKRNITATMAAALLVGLTALSAPTQASDDLVIVKDGKPNATIVFPAYQDENDPDMIYTEIAVKWLQDYVKKATGAKLKVVPEGTDVEGNVISIGHTKMAKNAGISTDELKYHACKMVAKDGVLYLIGNDRHGPRRKDTLWHTGPKGTCKAVTLFLEEFLGVRWFAPTPMGVKIPRTDTLSVPGGLNQTWQPMFYYVSMHRSYDMDSPAALANNVAQSTSLWNVGGHSWNEWIPASEHYDDHPEWFALLAPRADPLEGGEKRQRPKQDIRGHLCTSNPETQKFMADKIRGIFDEGFDWVELGQTDGWQPCRCEKCEALDDYKHWIPDFKNDREGWFGHLKKHPCERLFKYQLGIASDVAKTHPDKKVLLLGYQATLIPPKSVNLGDNVIMEICVSRDVDEVLAPWKGKSSMIHVYNNSFWLISKPAGILPKHSPELAKRALKKMLGYNVRSIYFGGCGEDWPLEGIAYYSTCRLLGDPDLDVKKPMRDYCDFIYGAAADEMMSFYETMFQRITETREACNAQENYHFRYMFTEVFNPELVKRLDEKLAAAEKKADSERAKGWLASARIFFNYLKANVEMMAAYERYAADESNTDALIELKKTIDAWKSARRDIVERAKDRKFARNFFPHAQFVLDHGLNMPRGKAGLLYQNPPVTMNFKKLFVKHGVADKLGFDATLNVPPTAKPPKIDGKIEKGEWDEANLTEIPEIDDRGRIVPTRINVTRDDDNLYVAFICSEPFMKNVFGKKGKNESTPIDQSEVVELLIAPPNGATARYLAFTPMNENVLTAEVDFRDGLRREPPNDLNPMEGVQFATSHKSKGKHWTVEAAIPFKTLNATPPKTDEKWPFDAGRRRWSNWRKKLKKPHLYRWSLYGLKDSPPIAVFK